MKEIRSSRERGKKSFFRIFLLTAVVLFLPLAAADTIARLYLKTAIEEKAREIFTQEFSCEKTSFDLLRGRVIFRAVTFPNPEGFPSPFLLRADDITVKGNLIPWKGKNIVFIRECRITNPLVNVDLKENGENNLRAIFLSDEANASLPGDLPSPERKNEFFIRKAAVAGGTVNVRGHPFPPEDVLTGEDIEMGLVSLFSSIPRGNLEMLGFLRGKVKGEDKGSFFLKGSVLSARKDSIDGLGRVEITNLDLLKFFPGAGEYLKSLRLELIGGKVDIDGIVTAQDGRLWGAAELTLDDKELKITGRGGKLLVALGNLLSAEQGKMKFLLRLRGTIHTPDFDLSMPMSESKSREFFSWPPESGDRGDFSQNVNRLSGQLQKKIARHFGKWEK